MPVPKISEKDVFVLIDVHEQRSGQEIIKQLPYENRQYPYCAIVADVADIIVCVRYTLEQMRQLISVQSGDANDDEHELACAESGDKRRRQQDDRVRTDAATKRQALDDPSANSAQVALEEADEEQMGAPADDIDDDDGGENRQERILFNPVIDYCAFSDSVTKSMASSAQFEPDKYIYMPVFAVERKEAKDMASSIGGDGKDPGFLRYKDQKYRIHTFRDMTGVDLGYIIEEFYKHCQKPKVGHLDRHRFDSALLSTSYVDRIPVHHTVDFFHTIHTITEVCHRVVKNNMTNILFPQIYAAMEREILNGTISTDKSTQEARQIYEHACLKVASRVRATHDLLYRTVPTANVVKNHSEIVSMRKKDNYNPAIRMQMQLSSIVGVSEKQAVPIQRRYGSMSALIQAYEAIDPSNQRARELMLKSIEREAFSEAGNALKIGPATSKKIYRALYNLDAEQPGAVVNEEDQ